MSISPLRHHGEHAGIEKIQHGGENDDRERVVRAAQQQAAHGTAPDTLPLSQKAIQVGLEDQGQNVDNRGQQPPSDQFHALCSSIPDFPLALLWRRSPGPRPAPLPARFLPFNVRVSARAFTRSLFLPGT